MSGMEPSLDRFAAQLKRRAANHRPRNPDGTFRKVSRPIKPRSAGSGISPAPSGKRERIKFMRIIMAILHEVREFLWPSDSEEIGIKRGYRDGRDRRMGKIQRA